MAITWEKRPFVAVAAAALALSACAEKKARVWIEPPAGQEVTEKSQRRLYYTIEDASSGRKENLAIPVEQPPENLVVEDKKHTGSPDSEYAAATRADRFLSDGKLPDGAAGKAPSASYLKGIAEIESMHESGRYADALIRVAPLLEQYPNQSRLFVMQGTLYRKIGEKRMALASYRRARELDRSDTALEDAILALEEEIR